MDNILVNEEDNENSYFLSSQVDETKKEKKRLPNLATTVSMWRNTSHWSLKSIKQSLWRRLPKTKPVLILLLINFLQTYGFILATDLLTLQNSVYKVIPHPNDSVNSKTITMEMSAITMVVIVAFPSLFYPLGGVLGDVYLGRQTISRICLFVMWISSICLTITLVVCSYTDTNYAGNVVVPVIFLVVIAIMDGVFQINWLTFGADQLCNAPTEEVSSFIYCFYWTKNAGILAAILSNTALSRISVNIIGRGSLTPLLASIALTVALVTFRVTRTSSFDIDRQNISPIRHICGVLYNATTSRPRNPFISAFRYGEDPPSGLEYAREYHGGKYSDEQVEDVRSFGRMILVIVTLSGFMITYAAFQNMMNLQMENINNELAYLRQELGTVTMEFVLIILIPILNCLIFPLMSHYLPNSRKRIGIGLTISVLVLTGATILQHYSKTPTYHHLLIIPTIGMGIAEASVFIPILEFIYAQSPDNMKGLLIGWHYFLIGVWSAVAVAIFIKFQTSPLWYYMSFSIISLLGLILFTVVSCCYRNRQRNNPVSDIMRISMYYK